MKPLFNGYSVRSIMSEYKLTEHNLFYGIEYPIVGKLLFK